METKINSELEKVFKSFDDKYYVDGILNKGKVIEDLTSYNKELLKKLLDNDYIKSNYTIEVDNNIILKVNDLRLLLEMNNYWGSSYTKYLNKIGLTNNEKYLDEVGEVVLDFPFKDTILKANMNKEHIENDELKPNEVFLNDVIAKEEIDVLLDKKVLKNVKKYDANGEYEVTTFKSEDNLIIRGNNLLALHSLREKYAGKIKLIYIDPPYNTGGDSFLYNDNFNHSTWLVFMKNRLEIAKELLREDGTIWINIDSNEGHYLKVLADNIFGRENFVEEVIWQRSFSPVNLKKTFSKNHDTIFVYAKNFDNAFELNKLPRSDDNNNRYKNIDNDPRGPWTSSDMTVGPVIQEKLYEIKLPSGRVITPTSGRCWLYTKERFEELKEDGRIWFGESGDNVPRVKKFLSEVRDGVVAQTLWTHNEAGHTQDAKKEVNKIFGKNVFDTPKPEKLLQRILTLGSDENEIVLDFFMGSATTQAVAMKMKRRFIGIEQMDYINTVSVPRLQNVINGEQGGISKDVNWQGGSSFIYVELMEKNIGVIKSIYQSEKPSQLREILSWLIKNAEIDFKVDLLKLNKTFNEISFEEQKKTLIKVIEKNQLYYNYTEIDDANVRDLISESDYNFNKSFYEEDNNEK